MKRKNTKFSVPYPPTRPDLNPHVGSHVQVDVIAPVQDVAAAAAAAAGTVSCLQDPGEQVGEEGESGKKNPLVAELGGAGKVFSLISPTSKGATHNGSSVETIRGACRFCTLGAKSHAQSALANNYCQYRPLSFTPLCPFLASNRTLGWHSSTELARSHPSLELSWKFVTTQPILASLGARSRWRQRW